MTLGRPSRPPRQVVELDDAIERPIGGGVAVRACDHGPRGDQVERLFVQIERPDGGTFVVRGVRLDAAQQGGVVVDDVTPGLGRVAMAMWGRCDVVDEDEREVARDVPFTLWVDGRGEVHVRVDGLFHAIFR